ncbi:MAG: amino acid ABC transporter permease [Alphaproteobacteria bacterium]|nr:amino acid ABC transporter permease [Alphaproteobacteria bacterium]
MSPERLGRLFWEYSDIFVHGLWITVQLSFLAMFFAMALGMLGCFGSLSRSRILRSPAILFVEFCRNTPILVQLVWVHFAWPEIVGIKFSAYTSAVIALALQSSGYLAEEFRAGIESIDRGQVEASQSLGMTYLRLMARIVVPQAVIRMIPGILNQFVTCFKSTSIVSIIAVPDLMYQANLVASATFLPMPVYTFIALIYFAMVLSISAGVRQVTKLLPNFGYFQHRRTE